MSSGKILFLSASDSAASKVAQLLFSAESERVELGWMADSRVVSASCEGASADSDSVVASPELDFDLAGSRVILLLPGSELGKGDKSSLRIRMEAFLPDRKSAGYELEIWQIPEHGTEPEHKTKLEESLKADIASYAVRLIMQGGRRTPLPQETTGGGKTSTLDKAGSAKNARVRVALESKGRRGKQVTCITGLPLDDEEMQAVATKLKQRCGTGGTVKERRVEIQGDNCDKALALLEELGYKAKRSGGPSKKR